MERRGRPRSEYYDTGLSAYQISMIKKYKTATFKEAQEKRNAEKALLRKEKELKAKAKSNKIRREKQAVKLEAFKAKKIQPTIDELDTHNQHADFIRKQKEAVIQERKPDFIDDLLDDTLHEIELEDDYVLLDEEELALLGEASTNLPEKTNYIKESVRNNVDLFGSFEETIDEKEDHILVSLEDKVEFEGGEENELELSIEDYLTPDELEIFRQLEEDKQLEEDLNLAYGDELRESTYGSHLAVTDYEKRLAKIEYTPRNYNQTLEDYRNGRIGYKARLLMLEKLTRDELLLLLMKQSDSRRYQLGDPYPCPCCGKFKPMASIYAPVEEKKQSQFYEYKGHFLFTALGHIPFCKKCMQKYFYRVFFNHSKNGYEAIYEMCRIFDLIFLPEWVEETLNKYYYRPIEEWLQTPDKDPKTKPNGSNLFNKYTMKVLALGRGGETFLRATGGIKFAHGIKEIPIQLKNNYDVKGNLIEKTDKYDFSRFVTEDMQHFWGANFSEAEIYNLESIYKSWYKHYDINNKAMEDNIKLLSVLKHKMDKQIGETGTFDINDHKTYEMILKSSGLQPIQDKIGDGGGDSWGEWCKRIEKTEPSTTVDARFSDVDNLVKDMQFLKGHKSEMFEEFNEHLTEYQQVIDEYGITGHVMNASHTGDLDTLEVEENLQDIESGDDDG